MSTISRYFDTVNDANNKWTDENNILDGTENFAWSSTTLFSGNSTLLILSTSVPIETVGLTGISVSMKRKLDILDNSSVFDGFIRPQIYDGDMLIDTSNITSLGNALWGDGASYEIVTYGSSLNINALELELSNIQKVGTAPDNYTFVIRWPIDDLFSTSDIGLYIEWVKLNLHYSNSPLPTYFRP